MREAIQLDAQLIRGKALINDNDNAAGLIISQLDHDMLQSCIKKMLGHMQQ